MKIIKQSIASKNDSGFVKFEAQDSEDMYYLYHMIEEGDTIRGTTIRNVSSR